MHTHTCIYALTQDTNNANSDFKNYEVHSVFLPSLTVRNLTFIILDVYLSNQSSLYNHILIAALVPIDAPFAPLLLPFSCQVPRVSGSSPHSTHALTACPEPPPAWTPSSFGLDASTLSHLLFHTMPS